MEYSSIDCNQQSDCDFYETAAGEIQYSMRDRPFYDSYSFIPYLVLKFKPIMWLKCVGGAVLQTNLKRISNILMY